MNTFLLIAGLALVYALVVSILEHRRVERDLQSVADESAEDRAERAAMLDTERAGFESAFGTFGQAPPQPAAGTGAKA